MQDPASFSQYSFNDQILTVHLQWATQFLVLFTVANKTEKPSYGGGQFTHRTGPSMRLSVLSVLRCLIPRLNKKRPSIHLLCGHQEPWTRKSQRLGHSRGEEQPDCPSSAWINHKPPSDTSQTCQEGKVGCTCPLGRYI